MTKPTETPTTPRKPDGLITTKIKNQTLVMELFWSRDSTETFQDKVMKIMLADKTAEISEHG